MTNSDRLQEIRERAEDATPGPWFNWGVVGKPEVDIAADPYADLPPDNAEMWARNAEFIAASREDIPYLLQLITEQQREIEELREELDGMAKTSGRWIAAAIEAGVSPSVTTEAKGYRKQERPI